LTLVESRSRTSVTRTATTEAKEVELGACLVRLDDEQDRRGTAMVRLGDGLYMGADRVVTARVVVWRGGDGLGRKGAALG